MDMNNNGEEGKKIKKEKDTIRCSKTGVWREINPDVLLELSKSKYKLSGSDLCIINYFLWNITSDKERNYIKVKRKTIQERTGYSKTTIKRCINTLKSMKIIKDGDTPNTLIFQHNIEEWTPKSGTNLTPKKEQI